MATPGDGENQDSTQHVTTVHGADSPPNGQLHQLTTDPTQVVGTMQLSDGEVLTAHIINGQLMWGQDSKDGWFSQDGTVFVPKTGDLAGTVEIGITTPDGQFLNHGEVRWINNQQVYGTVQDDKSFLSQDGTLTQLPDGTVEKSMITSDNQVLTQQLVNGHEMWGQRSKDGWFSQDGTVFKPTTGDQAGTVEIGITTPDGQFLNHGEVRWINNQQVYGTVQDDKSFLSQDGTLTQLPDGTVEKSMITSDNQVLTQRLVDGQEMWGQDSKDGWFSKDGTVFKPTTGDQAGTVEKGITTPDGQFLDHGEVRWINNQQVYGTVEDDKSFLSQDGGLLQLEDGTVEKSMVTSDNKILTQRIIDGNPMWGQDSKDGWFSEDGTVFVPNSGDDKGIAQKGITTPDGQFLNHGEVRWIDNKQVWGSIIDDQDTFLSEDGKLVQLQDGTVETSMVTPDNKVLTQRIIDGNPMWGQDSKDGWFSEDGTVFVPNFTDDKGNTKGVPQKGITAPDGKFLLNGQMRWIDNKQVWGSIIDDKGTFLSEDGTLLVLNDGTTETSMVTPDGKILTQRIVDGKAMWGQDSDDGWFSQDGTVFIPNFTDDKGNTKGVPQFGVTTPDGHFLPNGVKKTLPDGTVLYGYMSGNDFYSYDGKTLVLANGTIVHGSMDMKTGIFTATDGTIYIVTDSGIQTATLQSDGSYLLANGQDVMTMASWMIDIWAFADAQKKLQGMSNVISYDIGVIKDQYSLIESVWNSPAGQSFIDLTTRVNTVTASLETLLADMQAAMQTSYNNYVQTEEANIKNSTGS